MIKILYLLCLASSLGGLVPADDTAILKEGDILFQRSSSPQGKAIELATHSKFSHVGILLYKNGKPYVFEAVEPVQFFPLEYWVKKGKNGNYEVKRLKERDKVLTTEVLSKIHKQASGFEGKNYDSYFGWSDEKLYCSELVWKLYKNAANIEVGKIRKFKDYDFSHPHVQQKLKERYGNKLPLNENIVSPEDIYRAENLVDVVGIK